MKPNVIQLDRKNWNDYAVMGLPMSLVIIIIVSMVICSLYATGADYLVCFHQERQIKQSIAQVCDQVSLMRSYAHKDSQLILDLSFPPLLDKVIFGSDGRVYQQPSVSLSHPSRYCITFVLTNGDQEIIHSPIPFCDEQEQPLVFHTGSYRVLFSLQHRDDEVVVVGSLIR